ncbi:Exocyst complex component 7 [Cladochytrium tenue]|nr:Exocyst complex component 7 [Cladochytrium tenue]
MNTLKRLLDHRAFLEPMLQDGWGSGLTAKSFASLIESVLESLFANLDLKSKGYKRSALATIFLLNNYHFVLKQCRQLGLGALAGTAVEEKYEKAIVRQKELYRESWQSCFDCLLDTTHVQTGGVKALTKPQRETIKEKFKNFNAEFDANYTYQTACTIPDAEVRSGVLADLKAVLLPLYARFQEKYRQVEFSKNPSKYIKYDRVTLEAALDMFFLGAVA